MTHHKPGPIPILSIIRDAIAIPWRKRVIMFRALLGISVILVALEMVLPPMGERQQMGPLSSFVFAVLLGLAFAVFAVTCHRLILLGDQSVQQYGLMWTSRETRFAGWALLGYFYCYVVALALIIPVFCLVTFCIPAKTWASAVSGILIAVPSVYVFGRLSVLLPATAVDERPNIKWAYDVTDGNGWRLVLVVVVLPCVLWYAPNYLLGHSVVIDLFVYVAGCILYVIEIAALSLSYQHLTGRHTYSADSPGATPIEVTDADDLVAGNIQRNS